VIKPTPMGRVSVEVVPVIERVLTRLFSRSDRCVDSGLKLKPPLMKPGWG
jgi:hypothetical protein